MRETWYVVVVVHLDATTISGNFDNLSQDQTRNRTSIKDKSKSHSTRGRYLVSFHMQGHHEIVIALAHGTGQLSRVKRPMLCPHATWKWEATGDFFFLDGN